MYKKTSNSRASNSNKKPSINSQTTWKQAMREAATICPAPVTLTFDPESGIRVTCDVGYLCANFSLPGPLCSRLRPDVRDRRQMSDRRQTAALLNATAYGAGA